MPVERSRTDRLTEAALSGLTQYLVTNKVPEADAIAQIRAESTDPQLLSRVAGHQTARAINDPTMAARFNAAAELLVKAGGTDREAGLAERDAVLRRAAQAPPDAWRPRHAE
jgi:hypothetical protein